MDESTVIASTESERSTVRPKFAFTWYHDPKRGFVISQNVEKVPRDGWNEVDYLIELFKAFNPKLSSVHVELR